ncbi:MAG: peptidase T, partial [Acidobacteriota bacterium]
MDATLDPKYRQQMLDRFLRYVKVDTRSDEASETSPTTEKQKDLSRMLAQELKDLGCEDAEMNEWGYVLASIPGNLPADHPAAGKVPTIGLIAHVDTYFGTPGNDVNPQIIESYEGGEIELNPEQILKPEDNPNLEKCIGHTIIHTDGTTLLGADDKAGVAEIMTVVEYLRDNPDFVHGPI